MTEKLSSADYDVLSALSRVLQPTSLSSLAEALNKSHGATTQILIRLKKQKLAVSPSRGMWEMKPGIKIEDYEPAARRGGGGSTASRKHGTNKIYDDAIETLGKLEQLMLGLESFLISAAERDELTQLRKLKASVEAAGAKFRK